MATSAASNVPPPTCQCAPSRPIDATCTPNRASSPAAIRFTGAFMPGVPTQASGAGGGPGGGQAVRLPARDTGAERRVAHGEVLRAVVEAGLARIRRHAAG